MNPVLVFRHHPDEGPGNLGGFLDRRAIPWELIPVDAGAAIPAGIGSASGLVLLGGPMSANDPLPWVSDEMRLVREAMGSGVPVLGVCLGAQIIARALGARVVRNPVREIGWFPVQRVSEGVGEGWTDGLAESFLAFHWHGETFDLPGGARWLLRSEHCAHQAFAIGRCLALQCHVEVTEEMVRAWCRAYAHEIVPSPSVQTAEHMARDAAGRCRVLAHSASRLYDRWADGLAPGIRRARPKEPI